MNIDKRIAAEIRRWPSLFECRTDVLHFFFCLTGNGAAWKNGEIANQYNNSSGSLYKDEDAEVASYLSAIKNPDIDEASIAKIRIRIRRSNNETKFRVDNADLLAHVRWSTLFSASDSDSMPQCQPIYRLSEYSAMCNVPDDVKPEWLAAVREMIFMVFNAPKRKVNGANSQKSVDAEYLDNIKIASSTLTSLSERFPWDGPKTYEEYKENQRKMFQTVLDALQRK